MKLLLLITTNLVDAKIFKVSLKAFSVFKNDIACLILPVSLKAKKKKKKKRKDHKRDLYVPYPKKLNEEKYVRMHISHTYKHVMLFTSQLKMCMWLQDY